MTCDYKKSVKFDDEVKIVVGLKNFNRLKFTLQYDMYNLSEGEVLSTRGTTTHCFLNREGRPVVMDREMKEFYEALRTAAEE